jgi:threonylcarbamoyladenosine tRNA methylthiotransferase MtaB
MNKKNTTKQPTVALTTLGCKVNQYETASFQTGFADKGLSQVDFSQPADIYVINTCAVTAKAGAQSRQLIRRALRSNPAARFVVTGCYAQVAEEEIRKLVNGPVTIIANNNKDLLVEKALMAAGLQYRTISAMTKISVNWRCGSLATAPGPF